MTIGFQSHYVEAGTLDFRNFKGLKPLDYFAMDGTHYRIPCFASTDLASVPKEFWGPPLYLVPCGWYAFDAFLHDCGYQNTLQIVNADGTLRPANLTKQQCDDLLNEAMELDRPGLSPELEALQAAAIYKGVCLGGWHAFKEDRA